MPAPPRSHADRCTWWTLARIGRHRDTPIGTVHGIWGGRFKTECMEKPHLFLCPAQAGALMGPAEARPGWEPAHGGGVLCWDVHLARLQPLGHHDPVQHGTQGLGCFHSLAPRAAHEGPDQKWALAHGATAAWCPGAQKTEPVAQLDQRQGSRLQTPGDRVCCNAMAALEATSVHQRERERERASLEMETCSCSCLEFQKDR